jgi:hypothetical protein
VSGGTFSLVPSANQAVAPEQSECQEPAIPFSFQTLPYLAPSARQDGSKGYKLGRAGLLGMGFSVPTSQPGLVSSAHGFKELIEATGPVSGTTSLGSCWVSLRYSMMPSCNL